MASDNEKLYLVTKHYNSIHGMRVGKALVFRTRAAARDYAKAKNLKSREYAYRVVPAAWGPA